jgi:hypothetical protein
VAALALVVHHAQTLSAPHRVPRGPSDSAPVAVVALIF